MKSRISHLIHPVQISLGSIAALMILWIPAAQSLLAQDQHFHDAPTSSSVVKNPYADRASAVAAAGAKLYATNCGSCHGIAGRGTGNIPALNSGATQSAPDGEVFWFINTGSANNGMPSWNSLPERKRWQLVTYLKSLTKSARARPNQAANVRGES